MTQDRNESLNDTGKAGLVLAAAAIVFFVISALLSKIEGGGFLVTLLGLVVWAGKVALCIWLMVKFLRQAADNNGKERSRTFRFGMMVALCSAIVYAGFYLLYVTVIVPDFFEGAFDKALQMYSSMMTSDQLDQIANLESSMPAISFFVNLIWCWLFGTIISAIASSNICGSSNPFEEE